MNYYILVPIKLYVLMKIKLHHSFYCRFVSTPASNCTAERSYYVLKRMQNYLQSTMSQDRLNSLAILTSSLEYKDIIDDF